MTILALEADPTQANMIRHVARDIVQADVAVVDSLDAALRVLHAETPDVVLVPALLSPTDEADLLSAIRRRPDAAHVEMLTTPRFSVDERKAGKPRAWLRWGWHDPSAKRGPSGGGVGDETRLFAERLRWTLEVAGERRAREEDLVSRQPAAPSSRASGDDERRQQPRVFGPFEGQWRGLVDTSVSIRDISEGGCFVNAFCEIDVGQKLTLTKEARRAAIRLR